MGLWAALGAAWADGRPADVAGDATDPALADLLRIELDVSAGPRLRATLRNLGGRPLRVLVKPDLQPSRLVFDRAGRQPAATYDQRLRRKFDNRVYEDSWTLLAPDAAVSLGSGRPVAAPDGSHDLVWGPFIYRGLAAGSYRVRVEWVSAHYDWIRRDSGERGRFDDVPQGRVLSNEVTLELR